MAESDVRTILDKMTRLEKRLGDIERELAKPDGLPRAASGILLAETISNPGNGKVYDLHPVLVDFEEVEGAEATFTVNTEDTIHALCLGVAPGIAKKVIVEPAGSRRFII